MLTAPRSPWQNAYAERLIGSIRRKCLDHVIVINETGLARILNRYVAYYHQSRTHLSLAKDSPQPRPIARPAIGPVVAIPQVGGLHHRYDRRAAWSRSPVTERLTASARSAFVAFLTTEHSRPDFTLLTPTREQLPLDRVDLAAHPDREQITFGRESSFQQGQEQVSRKRASRISGSP